MDTFFTIVGGIATLILLIVIMPFINFWIAYFGGWIAGGFGWMGSYFKTRVNVNKN